MWTSSDQATLEELRGMLQLEEAECREVHLYVVNPLLAQKLKALVGQAGLSRKVGMGSITADGGVFHPTAHPGTNEECPRFFRQQLCGAKEKICVELDGLACGFSYVRAIEKGWSCNVIIGNGCTLLLLQPREFSLGIYNNSKRVTCGAGRDKAGGRLVCASRGVPRRVHGGEGSRARYRCTYVPYIDRSGANLISCNIVVVTSSVVC